MNKHCYRVIFSKTLNQLVVVSELSKSEGKHSGSCSKFANSVDNVAACLKPLCFSVFCALGFVSSSFADTLIIKADATAPNSTQPIVLQTANGIPQVNIQTPNAKGLSHNKYSKFDVDTKGAILNNSRKTAKTKLGGYVQGNPYLARGEAKVILNEVNSTDPSLMKGYVEVAGKKAEVIIANPSGITCQGCGFINSNRVTLTTGQSKIVDGKVASITVEKGTVSVSGKGLDNSQVDYTEILSQKAKINAGIWSNKKLSVVTGQNTIKRSGADKNLQIIHTKAPLGSSSSSGYAVDVSELGGMYSGKIHLVGTEQGLGVQSAGHIGAGVGEVIIDANGKIINSGIINANQQIKVSASDDIQNTGKIEAKQNNIQIKTKGSLKQDGSVIAQKGNIKVTVDKNITQQGETVAHKNIDYTAQNVNATTSSIIAAGVDITQTDKGENRRLETQSKTGKNITVHTKESTTLQGKNIASGKLDISATRVNLDNSQSSGYDVKVTASEGDITANSAKITAKNNVDLTTPQTLATQKSHLKAEKITTKQQNLETQNATWAQTGKADFNLTADSIKNTGGHISTQGNFDIKTNSLENTKGVLLSGQALDIQVSDKLTSTAGTLSSTDNLTLHSGELNNDKGLIQTGKNLEIDTNGKSLSNKKTLQKGIVAQGTINLKTAKIENQQGRIASKGSQQITATEIDNTQGKIQTENSLNVKATKVTNTQGEISANQEATLTLSNDLLQQKGVIKASELTIHANQIQSENSSQILANTIDILTEQNLSNQASTILANKGIKLSSQQLDNTKGVISSETQSIAINTHNKALNNTQGQIGAKTDLTINSGKLSNEQGTVYGKTVAIDTHQQNLTNTQTKQTKQEKGKGITALETLTLKTKDIENTAGRIASGQDLSIKADNITNTEGQIQTNSNLDLNAQNLANNQGKVTAIKQANIDLTGDLTQSQGVVSATKLALSLNALSSIDNSVIVGNTTEITATETVDNSESEISATNNLTIESQALNNTKGTLLSEKSNVKVDTHNQQLTNTEGKIVAGNQLDLKTGKIDSHKGLIQSKRDLSLDTDNQAIDNTEGKILTDGELTLSSGEINNTQGVIQSSKAVTIDTHQQNIDNTKGKVVSGKNLTLNAGEISNNDGAIAGENTTINATDLVQNKGVIQAEKTLTVTSQKTITSNNQSNINGEQVVLTAQEKLSNKESQIAAQNSIDITAAGVDNEKGLIVSEGSAVINTHKQKLNNIQGNIGAKTNLTVTSGELDNTQGLLQSQDSLSVNTHQGNLINNNTQTADPNNAQGIIAQGELTVTTQDLVNQQGVIASGKTQQITAENIDNSNGIITGQQNQTLNVKESINNQSGRVSAKGVNITSNTFDNTQQGKVLSTANLAFTIVENIDNLTGAIKGNNDVTLTTKSLNNQQGYIGSVNQNVELKTQREFNNTKGGIEAKNNINLSAKGINNQSGVIYTQQGDIDLNVQSHAVNNQQGEVIAGKNLNLNSGNITNTQGKLFANNDNNVTAINANIDNTQAGKIQAVGNLSVKAKQLDNQSGFVQSGKDSTLTIKDSINNTKVADTGSLIEAGKTLTITTDSLNNQNTVATAAELAQGIVAETLNLQTPILNNNKGGIYVQKQGIFTIANTLDNPSGEILGWGNLTINGFNTDLTINNKQGKIQAQQDLDINAKSLSMNGHLEADNLKLKLKDDVVTEQDINAKTSLSIETQGDIKNSKKLSANDRLTLNATNIENTKEGKLSSAETRVTAKETVTNRGLINSFAENNQSKTVVKGNTIHNLGTGRIYGDYVALEAENILNQDESVNGEDKSATIAARKRLDIAGKEIVNDTTIYNPDKKGGSTIYSEGDIVFGRTLNANDQAEGKAEHLYNKSSIIEATGSIGLNVKEVVNSNEHFETMDKEYPEEGDHNQIKYLIVNITNDDIATGKMVKKDRLYRHRFNHIWKPHLERRLERDELKFGYIPEVVAKACYGSVCYIPKAVLYEKDYIIWDYFGVEKPDDLPQSFLPIVKEPEPPKSIFGYFSPKYKKELIEYKKDAEAYNLVFKPYQEWIDRNKDKIDALNAKIKLHNKDYPSYYSRLWELRVKEHKVFRTVVKTSLSGQILAGQNIDVNDNILINDKSVIIAGDKINLSNKLHLKNIDEKGFKTDKYIGAKHWHASYKHWWHGRKWEGGQDGPYTRIEKESLDMNLFLTKDHTNPSTYKDYINVKQQNNIAKKQNEVELNNLAQLFNITKVKEALGRDIGGIGFDTKQHQKLTPEVSQIDTDELISAKQQQIDANNGLSELAIHKVALDNTQVAQNTDVEIRSITVDTRLPNQGLYIINPKPNSHYVIETDPEFTNHKKWLGSDYMFNALRYEPNNVQKRLGDGFYEQKLVREQINRLTGRQFLGDHSNFENQYKALMDNGVTFAKKFNLTPGISLSEGQVAQLTSDIVWLESQTVTLPNGKVEKVLVPKVYAMVRKGDITGNGTLISGNQLNINADEILNQGTIAGRDFMQLNANRLKNSGKLTANRLGANINGDVENIGGVMEADSVLLLNVAGDLTHRSTTQTTNVDLYDFKRKQTTLDRKALLYVKGKDGQLQINANNINITGADIINDGQGQSYISAKNNINLTALEVGFDEKMGSGNHYRNEKVQDVEISHIKTKGDMILKANNITSEGAELESQAKLMALAENDLVLNSATRTGDYEEYHYTKHSGMLSKSTHTTFDKKQKELHKGTAISGDSVTLQAGHNIESKASQLNAQNDLTLVAKNQINLDAELDKQTENHWEKKKKSGFGASLSGGVLSVGYSKSKSKQKNTSYDETVKGTTLNSDKGNVTVVAQKELTLNSAKVNAKQDTTLQGSNVNVNEVVEQHQGHSEYYAKSSGIGLSVVVNPIDVFKKEQQNQKSQGSTQGVVGKVTATAEALDRTVQQVVSGISPYLYSKKSSGNKNITQQVAQVSQVSAGKDLAILATEKDIVTKGAVLTAEGDSVLQAKGNVLLDVAENTTQQDGSNKASGFSFDAKQRFDLVMGAYKNRENGEGEQFNQQGTTLSVGGKNTIIAQTGDIKAKGATLVSTKDNTLYAKGDVELDTALSGARQKEDENDQGIGSVRISETEQFSGYNRKLSNSSENQLTHQGNQVASLEGNTEIIAGETFSQTSSELLAKNKVKVTAKDVEFKESHNQQAMSSHSSDLKIGSFTRIKSPIITLIQTVEKAIDNKDASDRVKAANALSLAAQGYSLSQLSAADNAVLFRIESGTGVAHSRSDFKAQQKVSQGNIVNAKETQITATEGNLTATNTHFTSKDEKGEKIANSSVNLTASKDILLQAGTSSNQQKGKQQSAGIEVGTAISVGAKTGWSVYGKAGFSKGKQEGDSTVYHNTKIDTENLTLTSGENTTLKGATAKADKITANVGKDLNIESLQDKNHSSQKQSGANVHIEFGIGTAWEFSAGANHSKGKSNYKQVNEQSGLIAGDGGYHVNAKNVDLKGGAIASTNAKNSELITNKITFSDIQNKSESSATSVSISGTVGKEADTEKKDKNGNVQRDENGNAIMIEGADKTAFNPSLPMKSSSHDSSTTKATLTEGSITLNKDTTPTQTTAKALGINTELANANAQIEKPNNVGEMLKEQGEINSAIGDVKTAVNTYTQSKQKEASEKLKTAKTPQEMAEIKAEVESWSVGGSNKRAVDTVTTLLTTALAGKSPTEIVTATASPYLNETIHKATEGNKTANLFAHAVLSAVEFKVAGLDPTAGALSGVAGEGTAMLLSEKVFNKPANQLTQKEKNILVAASTLAGTLAGATGGTVESANAGGVSAKTAVENNLLTRKKSIELADYADEFDKEGKLSSNKLERSSKLISEDFYTNYLIQENQKDPNNLNSHQKDYLHNKLSEIALEMVNDDKRLSYEDALKSLYEWDFSKPQIGGYYPALMDKIKDHNGKMDMFENEAGISTLEAAAVIGNAPLSVGKTILGGVRQVTTNVTRKGINLARKYPKLTETFITGSVGTGYDIYNGEFSPEKMGLNYVMGGVQAGRSLSQRLSIGVGSTLILSANDKTKSDREIGGDLLGVGLSTVGGDKVGGILSKAKLSTPVKQTVTEIFSKQTEQEFKEIINKGENK
ncbi:hemagglutinin repeat-containing protein [Pasteurella skyensis]|uniref:Hemagglutinin repeat-containing protein n=1 Tax=Phocoenobacter skyensis TaxID=97481 RepID=A0AAJ6NEE3_9PAST|nr:hemagglutinin repeat-containing protein [Pasteurella skyensis]MDP8169701.1 hemagglutinin repeat-containing protein [Pasteurella skyensis]MDP8175131.1 hemagglutinin repeat-containing protein [Pasteurella skyensis]